MAGSTMLLATSNPGKRAEFARLLPPVVELLTLTEFGLLPPDETGNSYAEIAIAKALAASGSTDLPVLADDSGLEVDALGGAPGIHSARYAGVGASDAENRGKLLAALSRTGDQRRTARFRCAVALARSGKLIATAHGCCEGKIADRERGANGFGYDPIFLLADGRTLAEVGPDEKDRVSHRGRAVAAIWPELEALFGSASEGR